jgi:hypothetical protein
MRLRARRSPGGHHHSSASASACRCLPARPGQLPDCQVAAAPRSWSTA